MQFLKQMNELYLNSVDTFCETIDTSRKQMLYTDYDLLNKTSRKIRLEEDELDNGRFEIEFKGINFKCVFVHKENAPLYVLFNGAKVGGNTFLSRWSYYSFSNGSMLNIEDPMFDLYSDLNLGWYYGNSEKSYREIIAELVKEIAKKINVANSEIIFAGSSGGGTVTIECASYIEGATAVAINPQVVLSEYGYSSKFTKITGINLNEDDKWHRNNFIYYLLNSVC